MKMHLKRIVADVKLTFEELTTILTQIESCLNSRPLAPLPDSDDGIEALTLATFSSVTPWKHYLILLSRTSPTLSFDVGTSARERSGGLLPKSLSTYLLFVCLLVILTCKYYDLVVS